MQPQTRTQQHSRHRRRILIILVVVFVFGVVSSRGVAHILKTIGDELHSGAHWLNSSLTTSYPSDFWSGDVVASYELGDDPFLFSPSEKSRLKEKP